MAATSARRCSGHDRSFCQMFEQPRRTEASPRQFHLSKALAADEGRHMQALNGNESQNDYYLAPANPRDRKRRRRKINKLCLGRCSLTVPGDVDDPALELAYMLQKKSPNDAARRRKVSARREII